MAGQQPAPEEGKAREKAKERETTARNALIDSGLGPEGAGAQIRAAALRSWGEPTLERRSSEFAALNLLEQGDVCREGQSCHMVETAPGERMRAVLVVALYLDHGLWDARTDGWTH